MEWIPFPRRGGTPMWAMPEAGRPENILADSQHGQASAPMVHKKMKHYFKIS